MPQPSILFVDDEPEIAELARVMFADHGYEAAVAANADVALVLLRAGLPFRLLITDVVLPGPLDGFALAYEARLIVPQIHVVYTTGFQMVANVRARGSVYGEIRRKPWSVSDMLGLTASILGPPPARSEIRGKALAQG